MKKPSSELIPVNSLFKPGVQLKIPVYQRVFKWQKDEAERFFNDYIEFTEQYDPSDVYNDSQIHFLGAVYLAKDDMESTGNVTTWDIVDGQQRITTLQLLIVGIKRAIFDLLFLSGGNDFNPKQKQLLSSVLNELDKMLFTQMASQDEETGWTTGIEETFKLRVREDRIKMFTSAVNDFNLSNSYLEAKVVKIFKDLMIDKFKEGFIPIGEMEIDPETRMNPTVWYERLIRPIFNKIHLLKVELTSIEDAYSTFERLNDRGVKLTVFELLNIKLLNVIRRNPKNQTKYEELRGKIEKLCEKVKIKPSKVLWQHFSIKYHPISEKDLANAYTRKLSSFDAIEKEMEEIASTLINFKNIFGRDTVSDKQVNGVENLSLEIYKTMNTPFFKYSIAFLKTIGTDERMIEVFSENALKISWHANINNTSLGALLKQKLTDAIRFANNKEINLFDNLALDNQMNQSVLEKTISKVELIKLTLFYDQIISGEMSIYEYKKIEIEFKDENVEKRIENIASIKYANDEYKIFEVEEYKQKIPELKKCFEFKTNRY